MSSSGSSSKNQQAASTFANIEPVVETPEKLILRDGPEARRRAARLVARGGLIAFRTDTFYGLGVEPFNAGALHALNELKGREGKPILVLVSDERYAGRFLQDMSEVFHALSKRFWPGALTLVGAARAEVPELLTAGTGTIGVRLPEDEDARAIVRQCGGALTATSANPSGQPPARTAFEAAQYFARYFARYFKDTLGLILDGGESRTDRPSTVLDVSGATPRLIREGLVTRAELEQELHRIGLKL
jgi:L-threonylcarbamoyladenylate synthase